jgi:hypothetical protein
MTDAHSTLTPAQRYIVFVARATVELHKAHGTEAVARWNVRRPLRESGAPDLPGGLMFAYEIAMRQLDELLAIIDTLTGGAS